MAQKKKLVETLKRELKARNLSYADVAEQLDLSLASVKRLFSEQHFSLERLDKICQLMEIEISDLVMQMTNHSQLLLTELSFEQEREIAGDIGLLLVTVCVLNHWTVPQLMANFHFNEQQCVRYLVVLDRLKLIELLPGNRIKLRVASNFKWHENGPIQQFFQKKLAADFFNSDFTEKQEKLMVINGMLSDEAMAIFHRKLIKLASEFDTLNSDERVLKMEEKQGTTVVLAMRNWQYGLFDDLRK